MSTTAILDTPATPPVTPPAGQAGDPPVPPQAPPATPPVAGAAPPSEPPAAPHTPPTAPETYSLTLPENGVLDASDVQAVTDMAKAKGWTNDAAQAALTELNATLVAQAQAFRTELDAHPEIGGTKFAQAQEHATRALDKFLPATSPEGTAFRAAMNKSGYGNYAPLMLLLSRIGKAMAEDRPISGSPERSDAPVLKTLAESLYPATTPV